MEHSSVYLSAWVAYHLGAHGDCNCSSVENGSKGPGGASLPEAALGADLLTASDNSYAPYSVASSGVAESSVESLRCTMYPESFCEECSKAGTIDESACSLAGTEDALDSTEDPG